MKRESTPFAILNVTTEDDRHIWAKFYWSKNSGMYGHQVITEGNIGDGYYSDKTGGCGFCKKSAALETFLSKVNGEYVKGVGGGDLEYWLNTTPYHVGGNAYELPLDKITSITELRA